MKLIDIVDAASFHIGYRIAFLTSFLREPVLRRMDRVLDQVMALCVIAGGHICAGLSAEGRAQLLALPDRMVRDVLRWHLLPPHKEGRRHD